MPSWIHVVILALATWRLASLLAHEDGPFEMFGYLRSWLGVRYDERSVPYGSNWLAKGVICVWCCSVWFGVLLTVVYFLWEDSWWLSLPLALSAVAVIVEEKVNG